jgi:hypothetical protein
MEYRASATGTPNRNLFWQSLSALAHGVSCSHNLIRDKDDEGVGYQGYHDKTLGLTSWYIVSGWNKGLIRNLRYYYLRSTEAGHIISYGPASAWEDAIGRTRELMFNHPRSGAIL